MKTPEIKTPRQPAANEPEQRYLVEREVSRLTGIALSTLRNWRVRAEGIPYYKIGRSVRYSQADVIGFMEQRRVVPGGDTE